VARCVFHCEDTTTIKENSMTPRMTNPALLLPEALEAALALSASTAKGDLPQRLTELVMLRASQINGCAVCIDMHTKGARRDGETEERLHAVAAWRDTAYFSDAERAALALAESVTRLSDRPDPVPDEVWDEAARHFDEVALASLLVAIGLINFFNRINVATRQVAGSVPLPA
jgi:AhpD family alkylhydroperoxidase